MNLEVSTPIYSGGGTAENVDCFVYLGSQISITGGSEEDVITKIEKYTVC